MNPILSQLPHHQQGDNPVFQLEARRAPWGMLGKRLGSRSLGVMVFAALAYSGLVFVVILLLNPRAFSLSEYLGVFTFFAAFGMVSLTVLFDSAALSASIRAINSDMTTGRWDLLRLTSLSIQQLIAGKHSAAQFRAWRALCMLLGARLPVVVFALLTWISLGLGINSLYTSTFELIMFTVYTLAVGVLLLVEPVWRLRAMTALGLAISAQVREGADAWLMGVAAMLAVWLAQGVVLFSFMIGWGILSVPFTFANSSAALICLMPVGLMLGGVTLYGFYTILQTWALRRLARRIVRYDG